MSSDNPFESPFELIAHARDRTDDLSSAWEAFTGRRPWTIEVTQLGPDDLHVGRLSEELPRQLSRIAFDIGNALRAALDQATHASVLSITGKDYGSGTSFPFGDSEKELRDNLNRKRSRLHSDVLSVCINARPWKNGTQQLWYLNKLRNRGSHRMLVTANVTPDGITNGQLTPLCTMELFPPVAVPQGEIALFRTPRGGQVYFTGDLALKFLSGVVDGVAGPPAIPFFRQSADVIEGIVRTIEAETARVVRTHAA